MKQSDATLRYSRPNTPPARSRKDRPSSFEGEEGREAP
jgi:hypothetical protein